MAPKASTIFQFILSIIFSVSATAQDFTAAGGGMTRDWLRPPAIQVYGPNVVDGRRRQEQLEGFTPFHRSLKAQDGLGPGFINSSCGGCHIENGRGPVRFGRSMFSVFRGEAMVVKVQSLKGGTSIPIGPVLQNHTLQEKDKYKIRLRWREKPGRYPDGNRFSLREPLLSFSVPELPSYRKLASSLRMTPPIIGPGLIEAIPAGVILALADPYDQNGDGISGRPNYVKNLRNGELELGRFGFKAGQPTVEQQSAAALANEMGMSNSLFDTEDNIELDDNTLRSITSYQKLAGVPAARQQHVPEIQLGKKRFFDIGCSGCHSVNFYTFDKENAELSGQKIHPFSDFLLHDMGPALADKLTEGAAGGSEWRTTPLWGLGFSRYLSSVKPRYLHDGRARSIEEAIIWHGGEAKRSRRLFMTLPKQERQALLRFLDSL